MMSPRSRAWLFPSHGPGNCWHPLTGTCGSGLKSVARQPDSGRNGCNRGNPEDYGKRELPENPFPKQSLLPSSFLYLPAYGYGNNRPRLTSLLLHPIRPNNGQPGHLRNSRTPCTEKSVPTTNWMTTLARRRNTNEKSRQCNASASRRWMN